MKKAILMGNEAIAYGAAEAGVQVAASYPGTPASEVLATIARLAPETGAYVEWSVNEKVALEVAIGASYAGLRSLAAMKQVGLNVAADPLMTLAYLGLRGGLVIVVADDPGPHSSQNEQDTRAFARFARVPVLDPATPAEAREMTRFAFSLSERLGLPVIVRPTTRVAHTSEDVEVGELPRVERDGRFVRDPRWVVLPALARVRRKVLEEQQAEAERTLSALPFNRIVGESPRGVICSGVSYTYVLEARRLLGLDFAVLKIGSPYPLPRDLVREFLRGKEHVVVVEELDPVLEEQVVRVCWEEKFPGRLSGKGDGVVPFSGEFDVDVVAEALARAFGVPVPRAQALPEVKVPARPPVLCPGCPHRASFYAVKTALQGRDAVFTGDIGCYTLGVMPPLQMLDTCLCMGASIGMAAGLARAEPGRPHVAFIGDSTFFHSGIPALVNSVATRAPIVLVVLDNATTAMTGFQPHPGTGGGASGGAVKVALPGLLEGCGVRWVREVDPYDVEAAAAVVREALAEAERARAPAAVVMRRECTWLRRREWSRLEVDTGECTGCLTCVEELGCPALIPAGEGVVIGENCTGCGLCARVCPAGAIKGA